MKEEEKIRQRYPQRIPYYQTDRMSTTEVKNAVDFIQKIKAIYTESSPIFLKFLEAMKDFKQTKLTGVELCAIISRLFADQPNLVQEFKSFIPQNIQIQEDNKFLSEKQNFVKEKQFNKPLINNTYEFINNTKTRLQDKEVYNKFIEILCQLKKKPINTQKINELQALLSDYPDLVNRLNTIQLEEKEEISTPFDLIKQKIKNLGIYKEFMKCINSYNQNLISKNDLIFLIKQLIKEDKLINEFIKYLNPTKPPEREKRKFLYEIGSYRVVKDEPTDALINDFCVGCPTHEREDENYVFLKRDIYEENLFRIEDERYEVDLIILRIELFIVSLEKVLLYKSDEEISISQLELSSGIIQSVLEMVYKENYSEVLEGIINKPKLSIPIVLRRLYKVNEKIKKEKIEKEKTWEEITKINFYKSLDNVYFDFKAKDKKDLMFKNISINYVNKEIKITHFKEKEEKITNYIKMHSETKETDLVYDFIKVLKSEKVVYINNLFFSVFVYLIILYERLLEIDSWDLEELKFSRMSRELGLVDRMDVEDRKKEIYNTIENFLERKMDSSAYEEELRILSKNNGYKLFNIDKIISKIENKMVIIMNDSEGMNLLNEISKENTNEKITKAIIEEMGLDEYFIMRIKEDTVYFLKEERVAFKMQESEVRDKFAGLIYDPSYVTNKVFLERSTKDFLGGEGRFNLEHRICLNTFSIKYVVGGDDVFMRNEYKRNKK